MNIQEAIIQNKKICLIAYSVSDNIEKRLHNVIELILHKYDHPKLIPAIYTTIKELLMNAVKANYKNIYFENYNPKSDPQSTIDYTLALKLFKLEMSRENAKYFEQHARNLKLDVKILLWVDGQTFHVKVTNPVQITEHEMNKVNQKLLDAQECDDITEYFIKADEDPEREGAGLGLIMISMMLKSLNIPQTNLRIHSNDCETIASLSIPLMQNYDIIE